MPRGFRADDWRAMLSAKLVGPRAPVPGLGFSGERRADRARPTCCILSLTPVDPTCCLLNPIVNLLQCPPGLGLSFIIITITITVLLLSWASYWA